MTPHRIRLRSPWRHEPAAGGTRWRRRFHRPTGLGPAQRVWVVVEGPAAEGTAALNGHALGRLVPAQPVSRFEITGLLEARNELVLHFRTFSPAGGPPEVSRPGESPPGQVCLEITARD